MTGDENRRARAAAGDENRSARAARDGSAGGAGDENESARAARDGSAGAAGDESARAAGDESAETATGDRFDRSAAVAAVALVLAGVLVPGLVAAVLASGLGRPRVATVAWVAGYGTVVLAAWRRWIRPLDLRGPVE